MSSSVCSIHCRFCFRKNCQIKQLPQDATWRDIRGKKDIDEVILSGGDPLCLSNKKLHEIFEELVSMEHLRLLRIHTRVPVSLPSRIDNQVLDMLSVINEKKTLTLVIHTNHPQELQNDCSEVLKKIRSRGILVLSQSVLLKGINDSVRTLRELSLRLIEHGILPYYLHQFDRVKGGSHFEVAIEKGKSLVGEMLRCTCGYGLPKYVQEIPGESSKIPL
jgi:KamA family protein